VWDGVLVIGFKSRNFNFGNHIMDSMNLEDPSLLTNADVYRTDKAFDEATNWWKLMRISVTSALLKDWVLTTLLEIAAFSALIASLVFARQPGLLSTIFSITSGFIGGVLSLYLQSLIERHYASKLEARKLELGMKNRPGLGELQFVLFRDAVPPSVRHPHNLMRLQGWFEARLTGQQSPITDHPFVLALVAMLVAIVGGISSQPALLQYIGVAVAVIIIPALVVIQIFPGLLIGVALRNRKQLEFLRRLELEIEPIESQKDNHN
jgi:hypothetical protein